MALNRLVARVKKARQSGYEAALRLPLFPNLLLRALLQKRLIQSKRHQIVVQMQHKAAPMLEAMTQIAPWQVMAFCVLLMGGIIVVVEAAKSSREVFWGDLFADDEYD